MKVGHVILATMMGVAAACPLAAQTPVLGSIEAPYPALQSQVRIAGAAYGPGAVTYGPAGTPLVVSGSNFGASGTVQFVAYKNGAVDSGYTTTATVTMWNSTMLFLTVPNGATSGLVTVTVEGKTSNGLPFLATPGAYAGSCPASPDQSQLQITTASLHYGTAGQSYSATLDATGGAQSYTWSIANGSLPGGLSLNSSTGVISGTPTGAAGPIDLTVQVTDSSNPKQTDQAVLSLTVQSATLTPATIYSYSASYDGVGNVTALNDSIMGSWTFQSPGYDTLNRLVNGSASSGPYSGQNVCWTYDAFGNRTSEAVSQTACNNNPPLQSWATYNASNTNRMDTDSSSNLYGRNPVYDAAGNLTTDGGNTYLYDAEGRICAVQSTPIAGNTAMTGYLYNADGERVAKGTITNMSCDPASNGFQLTESYVLGQGGEELTMLDGNNNWQRTNLYGEGKLLATYDPNGLHFHLTDPLGTRRMQVSASGQPETDIQSLPFGDQLSSFPDQYAPSTAADATPLHFTGKERDPESGNDYFGARYYASSIGRFMSPDWSAKEDPVPYANLDDPQSLNLYSYVRNNPLARTDPDGHCFWDLCIGEITLADIAITALVTGGIALGVAKTRYEMHQNSSEGSEPSSDAAPASPPRIIIDGANHPESAQHAAEAQAAGHPKVVTIDRKGARARRRAAQKGSRKQPGKHVDEYPPAVAQEGGDGASTKSITDSDNSGGGASMGNQMRPYPDGTQVEIVPTNVPNPPPPPPQPTPKPQ